MKVTKLILLINNKENLGGFIMNSIQKSLFACVILISFLFSGTSLANAHSHTVYLEGGEIVEGRTLVPLRAIFEELGAEVHYENASKKISASNGTRTITLTVGSRHAYVNSSHSLLDVPAQIKDGRTLVPLRFISESFGSDVSWKSAERQAVILQDNKVIIVQIPMSKWSGFYSVTGGPGISGYLHIYNETNHGFYFDAHVATTHVGQVDYVYAIKNGNTATSIRDEYGCVMTLRLDGNRVHVEENWQCYVWSGAAIDFNRTFRK